MSKITIHIGTPKTGTTAIQSAIASHESWLDDQNICFVKAGRHRAAHNDLANAIRRGGPDHKFREALEAEIEAETAKNVDRELLFSSEIFVLIDPLTFKEAMGALAGHQLKIVVYLRRQDQYAEAFYKQRVKNGRNVVPFGVFLQSRVGRRITNYVRLLDQWKAAYPDATFVPRVYDRKRLMGQDIVADFARVLGVDPAGIAMAESERNISPSKDFIDIILALAPHFEGPEIRRIFRAIKARDLPGFAGSADLFTASDRIAYFETFSEQNEKLRKAYFPGGEAVFDPPAPAPARADAEQAGLTPEQQGILAAVMEEALRLPIKSE
jgi:hypothetical protein